MYALWIDSPRVTQDFKKLDNLFLACSWRQGENTKKLWEKKIDILNGNFMLSYHRNCRATYTSPLHLKRHLNKTHVDEESLSASCPVLYFTRSQIISKDFDWKKNCFLCDGESIPTDDCLLLHLQRCIYQLIIWRKASVAIQEVLDPIMVMKRQRMMDQC